MRIAIKEVGKDLKIIDDSTVYRSECVCKHIKTDKAEFVRLGDIKGLFTLAVDENGLPKDLPTNFLIETNSEYWPIQKMVGTVVFTRIKEVDYYGEIYDYEVDDLTDEDIEYINRMIGAAEQERLQIKFSDYSYGSITPVVKEFKNGEDLFDYLMGLR